MWCPLSPPLPLEGDGRSSSKSLRSLKFKQSWQPTVDYLHGGADGWKPAGSASACLWAPAVSCCCHKSSRWFTVSVAENARWNPTCREISDWNWNTIYRSLFVTPPTPNFITNSHLLLCVWFLTSACQSFPSVSDWQALGTTPPPGLSAELWQTSGPELFLLFFFKSVFLRWQRRSGTFSILLVLTCTGRPAWPRRWSGLRPCCRRKSDSPSSARWNSAAAQWNSVDCKVICILVPPRQICCTLLAFRLKA